MADKHLFKLSKKPTNEEFMSDTWTNRKPYVGLVKNEVGGGGTDEVFYNFTSPMATILKVKIENPGHYGLGYISGNISKDKPTIINWDNGKTTTLITPITNETQSNSSTDFYAYYPKSGEYEIFIYGWYNRFQCYNSNTIKSGVTQINEVLIEVIQVSSLIEDFSYTFRDCKSLASIPSGLFDKNTSVTRFGYTFCGCSSLKSIPSGLFDKNINVTRFESTFYNCASLASIPSGLFDKNINVTSFDGTFSGCSSLTGIPTGLFDSNIKAKCFQRAFKNCSSLKGIPSRMFDKNTNLNDLRWAFENCSSLTGETPYTWSSDDTTKIKLWNRYGLSGGGYKAFYNCLGLTDYADIPNDWK